MFTGLTLKRKQSLVGAIEQPIVQQFVLPGSLDLSITREPLRLPQGFSRIRIIAGSAYVTYNREDHILYNGSELTLEFGSADAVIASLGTSTLVFEALR